MTRALFVLLLAASPAAAQTTLRFKWEAGQSHAFVVKHVTRVTETTLDEKTAKPVTTTATSEVALSRRWDVKAVDAAGTATLEMTLTAVRQDHTKADGTKITLDSADPEGAKVMAAFLNKPILTAKVDARGNVLEAKSTTDGAADRLKLDLPFRAVLPEMAVAANATWDRAFVITLAPPAGTGETYDAKQTYTFKGLNGAFAVIGVGTALKSPPATPAELQPLVSWLWEGDVFVNAQTGRYAGAKLTAKKDIPNHQGDGTKFAYQSEFTEAAAEK